MNITLFTRYEFDTVDKAVALFECLCQAGAALVPTHFGLEEPRSAFDVNNFSAPSKLLVGDPSEGGGGLLLKSKAYYYAVFNWGRFRQSCWEIYFRKAFMNRANAAQHLIRIIGDLSATFDVIFGLATEQEDWEAKHLSMEVFPDGGKSATKVGWSENLNRCLPGIYWITVFGNDLARHFGQEALSSLPVYEVCDVGEKGIMLVLRESPFEPELEKRLQTDNDIIERLGASYFFEINAPDKICQSIPGITQGGPSSERVREMDSDVPVKDTLDEVEAFEQQVPINPNGARYERPSKLAEGLIVYLHSEVGELFEESRASLASLDAYFEAHPQQDEYQKVHLWKELIPALGGYLGRILVKRLGGKWIAREPLLRSTVLVGDQEIAVFTEAYQCIYAHKRLLDVYDTAASSRT